MARKRKQIRKNQLKVRNNKTAMRLLIGNQLNWLTVGKMEQATVVRAATTTSNSSTTGILILQLSGLITNKSLVSLWAETNLTVMVSMKNPRRARRRARFSRIQVTELSKSV